MAAFTAPGMVTMAFINAGKASLLAYSTTPWPVLIAYLMFRVHPTRVQLVAVGVGGIAVMFSPLWIDWSNAGSPTGAGLLALLLIVSGIVIALWSVWCQAQTEGRTRERNSRQRRFFPH